MMNKTKEHPSKKLKICSKIKFESCDDLILFVHEQKILQIV